MSSITLFPWKDFLCLVFIGLISNLQAQTTEFEINAGDLFSRTIGIEEKHNYQVEMQTGEYAVFTIDQKGIDLIVESHDPRGNKIEEFDTDNGPTGPELVFLDAKKAGIYSLSISALGEKKSIKKGGYNIQFHGKCNTVIEQINVVLGILNDRQDLPGFAAAIIDTNQVLFQEAWGYANIDKKIPFTTNTISGIGSISKTFIGLSILKLVEDGKLSLSSKINDILPFKVIHPYHPTIPITVGQLASHTSGINYSKYYETKNYVLLEQAKIDKTIYHQAEYKNFTAAAENEFMSMEAFFKHLWTKEGKWYSKKNFIKEAPGTKFKYSNEGAALGAYIVEIISGLSYDEFTRKHIFEAMQLENTGWSRKNMATSNLATMYGINKNPLPDYTIITYPDGNVLTTISSLSKYFLNLIKGYYGEDNVVSHRSFREMMKPQVYYGKRGYGLFWEFTPSGKMGHSGGDSGMTAYMFFDPEIKKGVLLMCNMTYNGMAAAFQYKDILDTLNRYAKLL